MSLDNHLVNFLSNVNRNLKDRQTPLEGREASESYVSLVGLSLKRQFGGLIGSEKYGLYQQRPTGLFSAIDADSDVAFGTLRIEYYHDGGVYHDDGPTKSKIKLKIKRELQLRDAVIPPIELEIITEPDTPQVVNYWPRGMPLLSYEPHYRSIEDLKMNLPKEWFFTPKKI